MNIEEQLSEQIEKVGTAPFLFVGSGLSRRHFGLEDWEGLLRKHAIALPNPFEYYYGLADSNLPKTASNLATALYEKWWKDDAYQDSRDAFSIEVLGTASCLKYEIAKYLKSRLPEAFAPGPVSDEIDCLKKATIDGIITTNWDCSLERIFPDYKVYIGQKEILFSAAQGVAEIYKIHGCCTSPNSLVLTHQDYDSYNERNAYLAAKLLTIFVEHPVIFLGYRLADENITSILGQIVACLTSENIGKLADRLIFVEWDEKKLGDSFQSSVIQINGHAIPLSVIRTHDFRKIYNPLGKIKRRFPARYLRRMKECVYELVKTNDPKEKIGVVDFDEADQFDNLEVVYGLGVSRSIGKLGYRPINGRALLTDVLKGESGFDPALIVSDVLPNATLGGAWVPVFRYLRGAGLIGVDGKVNTDGFSPSMKKASERVYQDFEISAYKKHRGSIQQLKSVDEVVSIHGEKADFMIPFLLPQNVDAKALGQYLKSNVGKLEKRNCSYFRRLICFYDYLTYGRKRRAKKQ